MNCALPCTRSFIYRIRLLKDWILIQEIRRLKCLAGFEQSGKHLLELIKDLLDLSRLEANRTEFLLQENDLQDILENVIDELLALINDKCISLDIKVNNSPTNVICDKRSISQMMTNLLSNAIRFTEEDKSIALEFIESSLPVKIAL